MAYLGDLMDVNNEALDTQADSIDYSNEDSVNAAAAKEVEAAKAPVEQSSKTDVTKPDVADPVKAAQKTDPLNPPVVGQPAFDAEKSFADVQKQLAETRKWATQMAQERSELRKKLESLEKVQKPVLEKVAQDKEQQDLQQLLGAMQAQDPRALHAFLAKREAALQDQLKSEYTAQLNAQASELKAIKYDREVERRMNDSERYPNFKQLEPMMMKLVETKAVTWPEEQPIGEVIDYLYNLAKNQHSEQAILAAEQAGKQKAEAELAKEAKAAVATGGKGVSTTPADLHKMPLDKLEQLAIQLHGIADRD